MTLSPRAARLREVLLTDAQAHAETPYSSLADRTGVRWLRAPHTCRPLYDEVHEDCAARHEPDLTALLVRKDGTRDTTLTHQTPDAVWAHWAH